MRRHRDAAVPASQEPASPENGLTRRNLMRRPGVAGVTALGASLLPGAAQPAAAATAPDPSPRSTGQPATDFSFDPIRPPAEPPAVRSPHLSTWLSADNSAGTWPALLTLRESGDG
ncbi:hypothetical protein [Peterkaempfera sp. SMS 1(5)a]|uniref:hypothetical protein n=1 Tax=Peterkaempfera podocarpi TaxID=3232308 RepID=UPI003672A016